jgi:sigma-B regulation protein RsbQ
MASTILVRNNVKVLGTGRRPVVFAHGLGCDQTVWTTLAPRFERDHTVVLFDYVGSGGSDRQAFDRCRYGTLAGYAQDLTEVVSALGLEDAVLVGHSVSGMIGLLASLANPGMFSSMVMLAPSPRYVNDPPDYVGGFQSSDVDDVLALMDQNYLGWAKTFSSLAAPQESVAKQLDASFCAGDPETLRLFAEVTFRVDLRAQLSRVTAPSLIVQCTDDAIAPVSVGKYMHEHMPRSSYRLVEEVGHCPHLSNPALVEGVVREFLATA